MLVTELPIQGLLLDVIAILDRRGVPYAVMGGFAVRTWGVPRPTYDADLAVAIEEDALPALLAALSAGGFDVPREHTKGFVDVVAGLGKVKVTRLVGRSAWEVDLFLARGPFLETAMQRRCAVSMAGRPMWVLAAEDLILLKLLAFRRKDQLDVEEILKISPDVDREHLQRWAAHLGVAERLAEFLRPEG